MVAAHFIPNVNSFKTKIVAPTVFCLDSKSIWGFKSYKHEMVAMLCSLFGTFRALLGWVFSVVEDVRTQAQAGK